MVYMGRTNQQVTVTRQWIHEDTYEWTEWKNQSGIHYSARTEAFLARYTVMINTAN
jgi:hypothetical protein